MGLLKRLMKSLGGSAAGNEDTQEGDMDLKELVAKVTGLNDEVIGLKKANETANAVASLSLEIAKADTVEKVAVCKTKLAGLGLEKTDARFEALTSAVTKAEEDAKKPKKDPNDPPADEGDGEGEPDGDEGEMGKKAAKKIADAIAKANAESAKTVAALKTQVEKMTREREVAKALAGDLKFLGVGERAAELAGALYDLQKTNPEQAQIFLETLKSSHEKTAMVEKLFHPIGVTGNTETSAHGRLEKMAAELVSKTGITKEQAYLKVWEANPELRQEAVAEGN